MLLKSSILTSSSMRPSIPRCARDCNLSLRLMLISGCQSRSISRHTLIHSDRFMGNSFKTDWILSGVNIVTIKELFVVSDQLQPSLNLLLCNCHSSACLLVCHRLPRLWRWSSMRWISTNPSWMIQCSSQGNLTRRRSWWNSSKTTTGTLTVATWCYQIFNVSHLQHLTKTCLKRAAVCVCRPTLRKLQPHNMYEIWVRTLKKQNTTFTPEWNINPKLEPFEHCHVDM